VFNITVMLSKIKYLIDTHTIGHDTTASSISWILYSLALTPEWQKRCQDEIDTLLEDRDTDDIEWYVRTCRAL